ncbi:MAG TPA: protoporphyrinogen oxidase [Mycobacteriales bacterium]|jgi:oxygen-dependent protoporphyrinogen oxidase|nr:protoporphyrinogen oxidase [Mycobacteriales bacterium]
MQVVVVGGGIAGLAAAYELGQRGVAVTVVESSPSVGGKLRVSDVDGVAVDEGAEQIVLRAPEGVALVRAVGLGDDLVTPARSGAGLIVRGRLRPLPSPTVLGVPASLSSLRDVLTPAEIARAAADLVLPPATRDSDVSVAQFVGHRLGHGVVDRLVEPLLGGVYAGHPALLSAAATLPQLSSSHGSLLRAARRVTTTAAAESGPVFATIRRGLGRLPAAVASASGAQLLLGRTVRRIERTPSGWRVVHGPTTDEQVIAADAVVIAVPVAPASRLLTDLVPHAAADLAHIEYASMAIVTTVWTEGQLPPGTGYLVPAIEGRAVKGVTFTSAKWDLDTGGRHVIRCSIGRYGDVVELQRDDDDLVQLAVAELRSTLAFAGSPIASRVSRWGGGLPQYAVGHLDRVRRVRDTLAVIPGLAVCGAAYDGVGVPACIRSGQLAAAQVTASITTT